MKDRPPPLRELHLQVERMHCGGCASTIAGVLRRAEGVTRVVVEYTEGEGLVVYDPSRTRPDRIASHPIFTEPSPFKARVRGDREAGS